MSDLSLPPLAFLPPQEDGFDWPTPDQPGYASTAPAPDLIEIEGLNGQTLSGRLTLFDPAGGLLMLRTATSRSSIPLRFDQFRRLRVVAPLDADTPGAGAMPPPAAVPVMIKFRHGESWGGQTVGHRRESWGLFLFEPLGRTGRVCRVFIPATAFENVAIGQRLGETLVAEALVTTEQIDAALAQQQEMRERRLGDILLIKQIITAEELSAAIEQQARMPMVRVGEALMALGFINEQQLEQALVQQRQDRSVPLGELLVRNHMVSRADLQTALARKMGYPLVDAGQFQSAADVLCKLPYAVASRIPALPLMLHGGRIVVALEDPSNRTAIEEIEFAVQGKVVPVLARAGTLAAVVERAYEKIGAATSDPRSIDPSTGVDFEPQDAKGLLATLEQQRDDSREGADDAPEIEQSDNSLVRLINSMILEAKTQGVSDIHVECPPGREKVRIRFRRDGLLKPYMELPHNYRQALVARIKIMCDLDISERRKPQDGKINFSRYVPGSKLELRVATIPTANGVEDVVLRLLASARPLPVEQLGLSPGNLARFQAAVLRPNGMVLCVGPTGSGKTTTLHSAMGYINTPERKIWTAEDPVEITQAGLRQVQVNPKIDWTFAKALRAFLRADPDVIMVGEIRDQETAQVAIEASLTGHLVLSTLHTNSAAETVTRLLDMGMDPFNFADALLLVLAQRLVRRLCPKCRREEAASDEFIDELVHDWQHAVADPEGRTGGAALRDEWLERFGHAGRFKRWHAVGCEACDGTGYRGRAGIHEMMGMSRSLRRLIQTGARVDELLIAAQRDGLRTLRQDGIEKVLAGVTTIDEVRANS
jgi:type II secretory ATPase GspE/PulE/Tfp pilus assembly ATPase PilB-like protein